MSELRPVGVRTGEGTCFLGASSLRSIVHSHPSASIHEAFLDLSRILDELSKTQLKEPASAGTQCKLNQPYARVDADVLADEIFHYYKTTGLASKHAHDNC